jgi:hypothetical protein
VTLSIYDIKQNWYSALKHSVLLIVVMPSFVMLSVIMLRVGIYILFITLLNVIMLSVTILNVAETFSSSAWVSVTKEKRFITLTPWANVIKRFGLNLLTSPWQAFPA